MLRNGLNQAVSLCLVDELAMRLLAMKFVTVMCQDCKALVLI